MNVQTITIGIGERLVVLAEADYKQLLDAAEDAADLATVARFRRRLAAGEDELIPSQVVDRLLGGVNRIRVWREYRGLSMEDLADRSEIK